jgi:hypothetical protein
MMKIFTKILQQMPTMVETPSTSNHFGGATPFKVQFNFEILLFQANIDVDGLDTLLNLLEGYYSVQFF